jgi:hypothetical protein
MSQFDGERPFPWDLRYELYRRETPVSPLKTPFSPPLLERNAKSVKTLEPGECARCNLFLRAVYGPLQPGRYRFAIAYNMPANHPDIKRFGLTPLLLVQEFQIEIEN